MIYLLIYVYAYTRFKNIVMLPKLRNELVALACTVTYASVVYDKLKSAKSGRDAQRVSHRNL